MIKALQGQDVRMAVNFEQPVDQNEELVFSKTHSQVWQHLNQHDDLLETDQLPRKVKVFIKTDKA